MHGRENSIRAYDFLDDLLENTLTAEMMIMWARREILTLELPVLEEHIDDYWDSDDFDSSLYEMLDGGKAELE